MGLKEALVGAIFARLKRGRKHCDGKRVHLLFGAANRRVMWGAENSQNKAASKGR